MKVRKKITDDSKWEIEDENRVSEIQTDMYI